MKAIPEDASKSIEEISDLKQKIQSLEQLVRELLQERDSTRESESKFRYISENIADVAFTLDMDFRTTYVNPAIEKVLGFTPDERKAQRVEEQMTPESLQLIFETLAEEIENEKMENVNLNRSRVLICDFYHKNGSIRNLEISVRGIRDHKEQLKGFLGLARDITERKRMEEALKKSEDKYRRLSTVDNLTQLQNLRQFYTQLKIETSRSNRYGSSLTLIFIDIDDFKLFNDTYGHIKGDDVLRHIAKIMKSCLRETDFAYRYGGEEFTIILPMTKKEEGVILAERINSRVRTTPFFSLSDRAVYITISVGVAQYNPEENIKSFVSRVDKFMYKAKKRGKNKVYSGE